MLNGKNDFRSDTITEPTEEMRDAMRSARVGDDGREGDPTIRELEEYSAALLGKEAGLFFPSGTMSNQAALHAHTNRGDEIFVHECAHILLYEQGGAAVHSSLQTRCFGSEDGTLDPDRLSAAIKAMA